MNYELLADILPSLETYQKATPQAEQSVVHFGQWLVQQQSQNQEVTAQTKQETVIALGYYPNERVEDLLARLLIHANRYAKHYIRKMADGIRISTSDEFGCLASIFQSAGKTKAEIIAENAIEKPAGVEIINRLIKSGYVIEKPHDTDRRAKALFITEVGQQAMWEFVAHIKPVPDLVVAPLDDQERLALLKALHKLKIFHQGVWDKHYAETMSHMQQLVQNDLENWRNMF